MMDDRIRVTILDDHQSIVDGYIYRLSKFPRIEVVKTLSYGDELEAALARHPTDVLLLDVGVPTGPGNENPYPILYVIPALIQKYPELSVLVISMYAERGLIRGVMEAGASGYILKDDQAAIRELGKVVISVAEGEIYLSPKARGLYEKHQSKEGGKSLTARQLEALSLCAAYPNETTFKLAQKIGVSHSTFRNLLHSTYMKLGVNNKAAAIAKARQLGLISPNAPAQP